jgi:hypothetical protein
MLKLLKLAAPLLLMTGTAASAQPPQWRVSEVAGEVRIVEQGRSRAAVRGALLASGAAIETSRRSRAVIVRGREFVVISPGTRLRLPEAQQQRGVVQMLTDWGSALFRIERRETPHFGVQTPYLAAVVRGTTFSVTVTGAGATVQVTEGAVDVSTADGGASQLIRPGMVAAVAASDLGRLDIRDGSQRSIRSTGTPLPGVVVVPPQQSGTYQGPALTPPELSRVIAAPAISLEDATDGLVAGTNEVELAAADLGEAVRQTPVVTPHDEPTMPAEDDGPGGGEGDDGGGSEEDDNGHGNDEDGDDDSNPGRGDGNGDGHGNGNGNGRGENEDGCNPGGGNGNGNDPGGGENDDDDDDGSNGQNHRHDDRSGDRDNGSDGDGGDDDDH